MTHNAFYRTRTPQLLSLLILFLMISGCISSNGKFFSDQDLQQDLQNDESVEKIKAMNKKLKSKNRQLLSRLEKQKQLTAKLQLSLLEKHAETSRLQAKNEHLVSEFVRNKKQLRNRGNKVETARLIAEVAAVIKMTKSKNKDDASTDIVKHATQYLQESQVEVANENYEGATYLANQALDLIQASQMRNGDQKNQSEETEIPFLTHLSMKLLDNSNVREEPSMQAKIKFVQEAKGSVTAVGYKGFWVKVKLKEDEYGWIHHSLLSWTNN